MLLEEVLMQVDRRDVKEGLEVLSEDGARLGKVIGCGGTHFEVERGFFFPKDYLLAYDQVDRVEGHFVHLNVPRSRLYEAWEREDLFGDEAPDEREHEAWVPAARKRREVELATGEIPREEGEFTAQELARTPMPPAQERLLEEVRRKQATPRPAEGEPHAPSDA